jgi:hypothetical protein
LVTRRTAGSETWHRLLDWDRSQPPSERLTAHLLREEGFNSIDPSHPLGGPDGLKDVICERDGKKWIAAAYFPKGQQLFSAIKKKLNGDLKDIHSKNVDGVAFVTNQELTLGERQKLKDNIDEGIEIEIFHLERIASILNQPRCYGIRLDFLDIEMTKEEQVSFMAAFSAQLDNIKLERDVMLALISKSSDSLKDELNTALKKIDKNTPVQNPKITKAVLLSRGNSLSIYGSGIDQHNCSKCSFGFLFGYPSNSLMSGRASSMNGLNHDVGVMCPDPNCGNVDRISIHRYI